MYLQQGQTIQSVDIIDYLAKNKNVYLKLVEGMN